MICQILLKCNFLYKRKCNLICIFFSLLVYFFNKAFLIKSLNGNIGIFCRSHLNDLFCPLFLLGIVNILFAWVDKEIKSYIGCISFVMASGCVWEFFSPLINQKSVTDLWDLLAYFIGANIYFLLFSIEVKIKDNLVRTNN